LFAYFFGYEVDTAFVAAVLTILGYSINDGVVVVDRTRENLKLRVSPHFDEVVELSLHQTLSRSINTSVTVFLALLAIFLLGGVTTRPFALALLIGIAVGTPRGLVVPILRRAQTLSPAGIESAIADFAGRARDSKLTLEDLSGGTFSITNGGVFGSLLSTPILNPPQSAILGMHTIQERPVAENGQVVIRPMMYLALTYDHRLIDGRDAVQFLVAVKAALEAPESLLQEN